MDQAAPALPAPDQYQASPVVGLVTDDGIALAGWWQRVGATLIDGVLMMLVTTIAALPFYDTLRVGFEAWWGDAIRAAQLGQPMPDYTNPAYGLLGPAGSITLIGIAIQLAYSIGMQIWKSATLGMLALGLRVVPAGQGRHTGGLPIFTAVIRNLAYQLLAYLWFVWLVNVLLPLGNKKRQTLHDMVARTQVVKPGPSR